MSYVVTQIRQGRLLFMVDRSKQRASFWSDRLDDVIAFTSRPAALKIVAGLRFNNPAVMPLGDAQRLMQPSGTPYNNYAHMEPWDDHKF